MDGISIEYICSLCIHTSNKVRLHFGFRECKICAIERLDAIECGVTGTRRVNLISRVTTFCVNDLVLRYVRWHGRDVDFIQREDKSGFEEKEQQGSPYVNEEHYYYDYEYSVAGFNEERS